MLDGGIITLYREGEIVGSSHNLMTSAGINLITDYLTTAQTTNVHKVLGGIIIGQQGAATVRTTNVLSYGTVSERYALTSSPQTTNPAGQVVITCQANIIALANPTVTSIKNIGVIYGGGSVAQTGELLFGSVAEGDPNVDWLPVTRSPNTSFTVTYTITIG